MLPQAIHRVRQAYLDGVSPIDAILQAPLRLPGRKSYEGPLAPLIAAAIAAVAVQELLDFRTLEVIEERRQHRQET